MHLRLNASQVGVWLALLLYNSEVVLPQHGEKSFLSLRKKRCVLCRMFYNTAVNHAEELDCLMFSFHFIEDLIKCLTEQYFKIVEFKRKILCKTIYFSAFTFMSSFYI